ncbi:MAG: class I SAM-dependent methyltransferase [Bacteroidia bacterium]|nr:class I SAM-dependent methyltransferase [Bacteroidia bacterium]MCZ2278091.1 class I SAM-dependent methyltransferase [Bacteroidia bacterium]
MDRIPTGKELTAYYSVYSYTSDRPVSPVTIKSYHRLLDEFERYRKTNKILDSGCGLGYFLVEAAKRGWEVYGTEFSKSAIRICSEKGIDMREGALSPEMFEDAAFDVITSFEVLEHINNPHDEVSAISKLLRKDGLFYCTTPNFNSLLRFYLKADYNVIEYPEHLTYYTKRTLKNLVSRHGFKSARFLSTGFSLSRISSSLNANVKKELGSSTDEKLRKNIDKSPVLSLTKSIINNFLTLTNTGLTLKGYFEKI